MSALFSTAKEGEDPAVTKDMRIMEEKFTVYDFTKTHKGMQAAQPTSQTNMTAVNANLAPPTPGEGGGFRARNYSIHRDVMEGRDAEVNMTGVTSMESRRESRLNPIQDDHAAENQP